MSDLSNKSIVSLEIAPLNASIAGAVAQIGGEPSRVVHRGLLNELSVVRVVQVDGIESEEAGVFSQCFATQFRQRQFQVLGFVQRGFHKSNGSKGSTTAGCSFGGVFGLNKRQPWSRPVSTVAIDVSLNKIACLDLGKWS